MGCQASKPPPLQPFPPFTPETSGRPDAVLPARGLRIQIIANPYSGGGKGRSTAELIVKALEVLGHTVPAPLFTNAPGHAVELGYQVVSDSSVDAVLAIGGDGTSHEIVNGLAIGASLSGRALPPVILCPCGSGNTVAFGLGLRTWQDSVAAVQSRCVYYTDVIECSKPEDRQLIPQLRAPPGGGGNRSREAASSPPTTLGATGAGGASGASTGAEIMRLDGASIAKVKARLQWSFNMVGTALSTSVMKRANSLRWLGGAQYNLGALLEVIGNKSYLACIQVVEPRDGFVGVTSDALERARGELAAARAGIKGRWGGGHKKGHFVGFTTGASNPAVAASESSAASSSAASSDGGASGARADEVHTAVTVGSSAGVGAAAGSSSGGLSPTSSSSSLLRAAETLPQSTVIPLLMLQVQPIAYMGSKMSFCPLSRCNDGLMDIAAVVAPVSRLQCIALMDAAKLQGEHVLGKVTPAETSVLPAASTAPSAALLDAAAADATPSAASSAVASAGGDGSSGDSASGGASGNRKGNSLTKGSSRGESGPMQGMHYCQAKELILRPLDAGETARWLNGDNLELSPVPLTEASGASAGGAAAPADPAQVAANFVRLCLADTASAAVSHFPPLTVTPAPADASAVSALRKERRALNIAPEGMIGEHSLNIDGELSGFSPARLRVLQRVLPLVCNPVWQGDS